MGMTTTRLWLVLISLGLCLGRLHCEELNDGKLDVPANGRPFLFPVDTEEFLRVLRPLDVEEIEESLAVLCTVSDWPSYSYAVTINRVKGDEYNIRGYLVSGTERKTSQAPLEAALAVRIIVAMKHELKRLVPSSKDERVLIHAISCYFSVSSDSGSRLSGYYTSAPSGSRLEKLCTLSGYLYSLAFVPEYERTSLLGRIDRCVTEIELAGK
jgi:hypothetical protein